ncbi:glutaryl-CoA dehydrogenase, partial [Staphylococcus aureus]
WIGGSHVSAVLPVVAVNKVTGKPTCFVVKRKQDGVDSAVIDNKIGLRIVPNALIKVTNVKVDEADRLQTITSSK